jgi:hypothetical protein
MDPTMMITVFIYLWAPAAIITGIVLSIRAARTNKTTCSSNGQGISRLRPRNATSSLPQSWSKNYDI